MTIDEAIKHCEEVAIRERNDYSLCPTYDSCKVLKNGEDRGCIKCAEEHEQLAEWLEDYKRLLGEKSYAMGFQDGLEDGLNDIRPKGEWIIDGHHRRCKECGEYFCMTDSEGNEIPSNFCPNCGADMRKGGAE